jgi:hypothetical protein
MPGSTWRPVRFEPAGDCPKHSIDSMASKSDSNSTFIREQYCEYNSLSSSYKTTTINLSKKLPEGKSYGLRFHHRSAGCWLRHTNIHTFWFPLYALYPPFVRQGIFHPSLYKGRGGLSFCIYGKYTPNRHLSIRCEASWINRTMLPRCVCLSLFRKF